MEQKVQAAAVLFSQDRSGQGPCLEDRLTAAELIRDVALARGLRAKDITGPRRWPELVKARLDVAAALREDGWSYPRIGRALKRDHGTIYVLLHGRKR